MQLNKSGAIIRPDQTRVLLRNHSIGSDTTNPIFLTEELSRDPRTSRTVGRVMDFSESEVDQKLHVVLSEFRDRHRNIEEKFLRRFKDIENVLPPGASVSHNRKLLLGAYYLCEYSLEAAALFNPSIVLHPYQSGLEQNEIRFILSLRAVGEGHISSIEFQTGIITSDLKISIDQPTRYVSEGEVDWDQVVDRLILVKKLKEMGLSNDIAASILDKLRTNGTLRELRFEIEKFLEEHKVAQQWGDIENAARSVFALARSNYDVRFAPDIPISERVIFPLAPCESNGIEDARFVRFIDDDGSVRYFGTYTAYDGRTIRPKLLETDDFIHFKIRTMGGPAVRNKGTALFPRKVNGDYVMLSRQDGENNSIMFSDHVEFWKESRIIMEPKYDWEFIQIGNCGSPVETDDGWLVLSHGVGPVRKYCIGAYLLDKDDPSKLIGRTREPIILPEGDEREGYVPNVVYTCGMLQHMDSLIIPYAKSDYAIGFATVPVKDVIQRMG
jgi:predicted GH43/DUF377 family glycosyl hydrolase